MPSIYIFYCGVPVLIMYKVDLIDPTSIMDCQWTPKKMSFKSVYPKRAQ